MKNTYDELKSLFYEYQPNDEEFLEDNPETAEQIESIDQTEPNTESEIISAISNLCDFMEEWFPDSVDEDEQKRIRTIIDEGYKIIKKK